MQRHFWLDCLFALLGSTCVEAAGKHVGEIDPCGGCYKCFGEHNDLERKQMCPKLNLNCSNQTCQVKTNNQKLFVIIAVWVKKSHF